MCPLISLAILQARPSSTLDHVTLPALYEHSLEAPLYF
jgi:hypothetical protein